VHRSHFILRATLEPLELPNTVYPSCIDVLKMRYTRGTDPPSMSTVLCSMFPPALLLVLVRDPYRLGLLVNHVDQMLST